MTVLLVLATFMVFMLFDYAVNKAKKPAILPVMSFKPVAARPIIADEYVAGFLTPDNVRYHAGHGWLARERKNIARVGVDEFAAALGGKLDKIELPKPGQWIRQGQRALSMFRKGDKVDLVSPIEGEVIEVNPDVVKDPSLVRSDPYGRGWLMKVHVPDEDSTTRNFVPKGLVRNWMRDAVENVYALQPQLAGAALPDGGRPAEDLLAGVEGVDWKEVAGRFFLTAE